ncbi:hypothetical protein V7087_06570 [Neobacillus niacini]|uniref:hypothetical protein n=1 Tax=Neobacillus niacini TaxID=86668 RepID=UPI003000C693
MRLGLLLSVLKNRRAAFAIHSQIHAARPDVIATAHAYLFTGSHRHLSDVQKNIIASQLDIEYSGS